MKHVLLILTLGVFSFGINAQCVKEPFALYELFTSEGCSSCPPIDKLFNSTANNNSNLNVISLAHHVDYWNVPLPSPCPNKTWVDPFSSSDATASQGEYKGPLNSALVTPLIVVQGKRATYTRVANAASMTFSEIPTVLSDFLAETPKSGVCIEYVSNDESANTITFNYTLIDTDNNLTERLVYFVYEDKLYDQKITSGENCNKTLDHERVRRTLEKKVIITSADKSGQLTVTYPTEAVAANLGVAAFVQNIRTKEAVGGTKGFQLGDYIATSVDDVNSDLSELTVYPNPASDQVIFNLEEGMDYVEILDVTGKMVQSTYNIANRKIMVDLQSNITPGMYFFKVGSQFTSIAPKTGKLIVK